MKMSIRSRVRCCLALGSVVVMAACAGVPLDAPSADTSMTYAGTAAAAAVAYGTVRGIDTLDKDMPRGTGAILGGIIGAAIGRQIGDGSSDKNVGTAIGAAAGAIIGHEIEKGARRETGGVRITVALDDGSTRRFDFKEPGGLRVGDRVRIEGNNLFKLA
jgi:outer membrane lipoprotein SlyB